MTTTLITGANKGLGYETARRLIEAGHTVWIGARDETRGRQAADELGARFVQLDVTDDASVAAAAADVGAAGGLDVLVNNAGITGPHADAAELTGADALAVFDTNVVGIVRTTSRLPPAAARLRRPDHRQRDQRAGLVRTPCTTRSRIESTVVAPLYTSSKSAVTMLTVQYAKAFPGDPDQRRRPRLHGDRPQRQQRAADGHRGHRRHRRAGHSRAPTARPAPSSTAREPRPSDRSDDQGGASNSVLLHQSWCRRTYLGAPP